MTNALGDQQAQPPNRPPIPKLFTAPKSHNANARSGDRRLSCALVQTSYYFPTILEDRTPFDLIGHRRATSVTTPSGLTTCCQRPPPKNSICAALLMSLDRDFGACSSLETLVLLGGLVGTLVCTISLLARLALDGASAAFAGHGLVTVQREGSSGHAHAASFRSAAIRLAARAAITGSS